MREQWGHATSGSDAVKKLIVAADLEAYGIKRGTAYSLARKRVIPSYRVGSKQTGVRFVAEEVLAALRQGPMAAQKA